MSLLQVLTAAFLLLLTLPGHVYAQCGFRSAQRVTHRQGVPFQATEIITRNLPSGVRSVRGRMARNSAGSTSVEVVDPRSGTPSEIVIFDVVNRQRINLDLNRKEYTLLPLPELQSQTLPLDWELTELRRADQEQGRSWHESLAGKDVTFRNLGKDRVGGLVVVGWVEEQQDSPASSQSLVRNPPDICETWLSVDLGILVRVVARHPAAREETEVRLTEILRAEPDPKLFTIPETYHPASHNHQKQPPSLPPDDGM